MQKRCRTHRTTVMLLVLLLLLGIGASMAWAGVALRQIKPPELVVKEIIKKPIPLPEPRLAQVTRNKQVANMQQIQQNYFMRNGIPFIRGAEGEEFELIPLDKMEYTPTAAQVSRATRVLPKITANLAYINAGPLLEIPAVVDHRPDQTPVKSQGNRGTCVCFASMAGLEVAYGGGSLDLSEQFANYLYMTAESRGCKDAGLYTHMSANYLANDGVCRESVCPYQNNKYSFPAYCNNGAITPVPPMRADAVANRPFKIKSYQKIWRNDSLTTDTGIWINNPRYLECLLRAGHDIVFGTHVAGWVTPYTGIIDVKLTGGGDPLPSVGGHAMLVVGYDRNQEYFIVKNSWGTSKGQAGYVYLSYDYIRTYAKYGYVITDVEPIPLKLITPMLRAVPMIRSK